MDLERHALARHSLRGLSLPEPIAQYRPGLTERINTNPFAGSHRAYPTPAADGVRADYARWLNRDSTSGAGLIGDHVLFTAGSIAGLDLLLRAFCEPFRDEVCVQSPTFPFYAQLATAYDIAVHDVPLAGEFLNVLDAHKIRNLAAKLTFICTPNNPTGCHVTRDVVLDIAAHTPGLVVVDEAYVEFSRFSSLAQDVPLRPNLVVLRTFSKAWGLAGLRVGAVVAHPSVIETLRIIQDPYSFHAVAQKAVADRLQHQAEVEFTLTRIRSERERMANELRACAAVQRVFPSESNFILVQARAEGAIARLAPDLLVSDMHQVLPRALRICVGDEAHNDEVLFGFRSLATKSHPSQYAEGGCLGSGHFRRLP
ncbi:aminotransferase class I/II-fold pyridoxal phosphate-dependent enzyme [Mycolicibacterium boenickei]